MTGGKMHKSVTPCKLQAIIDVRCPLDTKLQPRVNYTACPVAKTGMSSELVRY